VHETIAEKVRRAAAHEGRKRRHLSTATLDNTQKKDIFETQ